MIKYLNGILARHLIVSFCLAFPIILTAQPLLRVQIIETGVFKDSSILAEKYILILPGFTVDGNSNVDKFYTYSIDTNSCLTGNKKQFAFSKGDSATVDADAAGTGPYSWKGPNNFNAIGLKVKISIRDTGETQYFVTNARHCTLQQDTVLVKVNAVSIPIPNPIPEKEKNENFEIYNAVSPNGDGKKRSI